MTSWKSRSYSKHSDSAGKALKELSGGTPLPNQARSGNGYGRPEVQKDVTDNTLQGDHVINRNVKK